MSVQNLDVAENLIKSCKSCGHVTVCAVFRAIAPLVTQSWDENTRPFEPDLLANICKKYVSTSVLQILNS